MLVLSRKIGERTIIAGRIRVVVLGIHGNHVKLGFEAPETVPIYREEIYQGTVRQTQALPLAGVSE